MPRLTPVVLLALAAAALVAPLVAPVSAQRARRDRFFSEALGVQKHLMVYLPPSYDRDVNRRYPVVYYLHGLSGAEGDWLAKGGIDVAADSLFASGAPEMIIVMPDGDDGWYTTWSKQVPFRTCADTLHSESATSYCVEHERYDDYVAHDVVRFVDSHYRTRADRAHRGVAGLSMGGYGATILALHYPDTFAAAASHSGVVSALYVAKTFVEPPTYANSVADAMAASSFAAHFRLFWGDDMSVWRAADPAVAAESLLRRHGNMPALFLDCGVDDGLLAENRALHSELTRLGIAHTYAEWPGAHTWRYWSTHVHESLAWMAARIGH